MQCLEYAKPTSIKSTSISPFDEKAFANLNNVLNYPQFQESVVYYTGYKWRSDPHCGVFVNIDYLSCRDNNSKTVLQRRNGLVLLYPRVFVSPNSELYIAIRNAFNQLAQQRGSLWEHFVQRYQSESATFEYAQRFMQDKDAGPRPLTDLIGIWGEGTKQARIFRQYADLIILGDSIIPGTHWRETIEGNS